MELDVAFDAAEHGEIVGFTIVLACMKAKQHFLIVL